MVYTIGAHSFNEDLGLGLLGTAVVVYCCCLLLLLFISNLINQGLTFQVGTHQLFSGSLDRTVRIWNLDEMAYVETL